ncbi:MAG: B12-binding domain-containing radical SAM protein [Polyangiaceae bacterium]|nr:B12-binding domain-containing radical SAM protein [Polyangiaceae bacterium]
MPLVSLIRPPCAVGRLALTLNVTPPLSVACLAGSLTEAGFDVEVIDALGEGVHVMQPGYHDNVLVNGLATNDIVDRIDPSTELVAISCMFSTDWPIVRDIIAAIDRKFPGIPILCGGEHPTAAPEHALRSAPALLACALGEGEETIVDAARAITTGKSLVNVAGLVVRTRAGLVRTAARARIREVDAIPLPRWDLTPIETYLAGGHSFGVDRGRTMPIVATRGCPYQCTFCSSPRMWTTRYVTRKPSLVVDEIESYVRRYDVDNIDFYDLTAIIRKDWIVAFCEELMRRRIDITWQLPSGTRSEAIDGDVARLLYRSGCRNVSYAPESGSKRTLKAIKKKVNLDRMDASMRAAVTEGLNVKANILVGFPEETHDEILESLRFVAQMAVAGVHDVSIWTFSPYPGSELFDALVAQGKIGELDDEYFAALLSYSDLAGAVSWSSNVSSQALRVYRLLGLTLFYSVSFGMRPWRFVTLAANAVTGRYESRLEMSLANLGRKLSLAWGLS